MLSEIELGRIKGPFDVPPFDPMHISLISIREKSEGRVRLLHNLPFPYDSSFNFCIHRDLATVQHTTVGDAIEVIQHVEQYAYLVKSDIKLAFRLWPITPSERHLLKFQGKSLWPSSTCSMQLPLFVPV